VCLVCGNKQDSKDNERYRISKEAFFLYMPPSMGDTFSANVERIEVLAVPVVQ
jgi:hypothetical protein